MCKHLEDKILELVLLCSRCGLNLKESKKYRMHSYWKAYCLAQDWQSYICNLYKDKPIQAPFDQSQIKWQRFKNSSFIKHLFR